MLPSLGKFLTAIIGGCVATGLIALLSEKKNDQGEKMLSPSATIVLIVVTIIAFVGYLFAG